MSKIGFIYKLACKDTEITEIYIGSTKNMRVRKSQHKSYCHNENRHEYNFRVYQFIREHGGFDNWGLFQIEEIKYDTTFELHARERYHIELLKPSLNVQTPNRPPLESSRAYYQKNRETCLANSKIKLNCECGGKYINANKSRHEKTNKHINYINSINLIEQLSELNILI